LLSSPPQNYDYFGSWTETAGPNGPLNRSCAPLNDQGSAADAVAAWTAAGIPVNQLVLAVPAYGHSFVVNRSAAFNTSANGDEGLNFFPSFDKDQHPAGDKWDDGPDAGPDVCGNPQLPGGSFAYRGLIEAGYLDEEGSATKNVSYAYDECSQTVRFLLPLVHPPVGADRISMRV